MSESGLSVATKALLNLADEITESECNNEVSEVRSKSIIINESSCNAYNVGDEVEMRKNLSNALKIVINLLVENCPSIQKRSVERTMQLINKSQLENAKTSTTRLLLKEVQEMVEGIDEDIEIPNKRVKIYTEKAKEGEFEVLVHGCTELAQSLAEGFTEGVNPDFRELSKTPVEFAQYVNNIKKNHDVGLAKLRGQVAAENAKKSNQTSNETRKIVEDLLETMQRLAEQSKQEYNDLIENY